MQLALPARMHDRLCTAPEFVYVTLRHGTAKHFKAQRSLYVPYSGHYMYRTVVTICTASLTLGNSTFCSHSVFMCFMWIWEQTAIIFLYTINWLVFKTETGCVYCAVRTGSLYIILRSAHTVYLCVLCGSQNKQRLFSYSALTVWFLKPRRSLFTARYGLNI